MSVTPQFVVAACIQVSTFYITAAKRNNLFRCLIMASVIVIFALTVNYVVIHRVGVQTSRCSSSGNHKGHTNSGRSSEVCNVVRTQNEIHKISYEYVRCLHKLLWYIVEQCLEKAKMKSKFMHIHLSTLFRRINYGALWILAILADCFLQDVLTLVWLAWAENTCWRPNLRCHGSFYWSHLLFLGNI